MNTGRRERSGLQQGQFVDLTSHYKGETRIAKTLHGRAVRHSPWLYRGPIFQEANVLVSIITRQTGVTSCQQERGYNCRSGRGYR